jgi:hypothetical protein
MRNHARRWPLNKTPLQDPPQGVIAHEHTYNQILDPPSLGSNPGMPTHAALSYWDINRKLEKLEQNYGRDQKRKPAEIQSSSIGNRGVAAISYASERLKEYADEMEAVYETEIKAGRFADTPDLWAAVYAQKILPSVSAKINGLVGNLAFRMWRTGGGGPGEQEAVEKAQRELSRLRTGLECKLASACSHAEDHNGFNLSPLPQEEVEKKRASDVVKVMKEIADVGIRMDSDDDYGRLKAEYPTFILFKECDKDPELKSLFLGIKGHHQKKALRFAKQVAASHHGVKLNTIEKAWDRYNPNKKPRHRVGTAPASAKGATRARSESHG